MNIEEKKMVEQIISNLKPSDALVEKSDLGIPEDQLVQKTLYSLGVIIGSKGTPRIRVPAYDKSEKLSQLEDYYTTIQEINSQIEKSEEKSLTRQNIIKILESRDLDEDDYYNFLSIMSLAGLVISASGRTGGFQKFTPEENKEAVAQASKKIDDLTGKAEKDEAETEHEEVLYPSIAKLLNGLGYEAKILGRKRRLPGEWNTPDVLGYKVRRFEVVGMPDIETVTIEAKWHMSKYGIAETLSHQKLSHYSYLMVNQELDDIENSYREELISHGVGLIALIQGDLKIIIPPISNHPDPEIIDGFLNLALDQDEKDQIKEDISTRLYNLFIKSRIKLTLS